MEDGVILPQSIDLFIIETHMRLYTRIIKIDPGCIESSKIKTIADVLKNEGIVIYPTDTFYGLGANCFSRRATQRIYEIKKRAFSRPLSVVISDVEMLAKIVSEIPPQFESLSKKFWPGPLTLIFKASTLVPKELLSPEGSIGVRLPAHPWVREMVKYTSFPVTATSANISGKKEMADPGEVVKIFYGKVDLIADGGKTAGILPSTVVDLTLERPRIIRKGVIPSSELRKYFA